jgi:TolB-like protein
MSFPDRLNAAVIDRLGRVPGRRVFGRASVFLFKGKFPPVPKVARPLGVTHLAEGAMLQEGQTVRVTTKLIQADGFQEWVSHQRDRELKQRPRGLP